MSKMDLKGYSKENFHCFQLFFWRPVTDLTSSTRSGQRRFFKSQICAGLIPTDFQPYKLIPNRNNSSMKRNSPLYMRNAGSHWISLSALIAEKKNQSFLKFTNQVTVIILAISYDKTFSYSVDFADRNEACH